MFYLLQENGDNLLQENGDKIIIDTSYFIAGMALLAGSPIQNAKITLIDSDSDEVVSITLTDADGRYSFFNLEENKQYHVTGEYEDSPDQYNAKSLPFMQPVR